MARTKNTSKPNLKITEINQENMATVNASIINELSETENVNLTEQLENLGVPLKTTKAKELKIQGQLIDELGLGDKYLALFIDKICIEIVRFMSWENILGDFRQGSIEHGRGVQEIFIEMAKGQKYDTVLSEAEIEKRVLPKVHEKIHTINSKIFYKVTEQIESITEYFNDIQSLTSFASGLIESLRTGMEYDEYLTYMYLVGRSIVDGDVHIEVVGDLSPSNISSIVTKMKKVTSDFKLPSKKYNAMEVITTAPLSEQHILETTEFSSVVDVEVLAKAFNLGKVEFLPPIKEVNKFSELDFKRLTELYGTDEFYKPFTVTELEWLDSLHCVLFSKKWFMVYNRLFAMKTRENEQGLYKNFWLHTHNLYSTSPFANIVAFMRDERPASEIAYYGNIQLIDTLTGDLIDSGDVIKGRKYKLSCTVSDPTVKTKWKVTDNYLNPISNGPQIENDEYLYIPFDFNKTSFRLEIYNVGRTGNLNAQIMYVSD